MLHIQSYMLTKNDPISMSLVCVSIPSHQHSSGIGSRGASGARVHYFHYVNVQSNYSEQSEDL